MGGRAKPKKLNAQELWDYSLRVLGTRPHSANELRQKLTRRAESPLSIAETLTKLREYGFTDDKKFSEAFASSRLENRGFGSFRVLQELRSKRVADGTATEAVIKAYAGTKESELVDAFLARKYRSRDLRTWLQEQKNLASAYRRLRTAGFSSGASLSALKRYSTAVDDWEEPPPEE